MAMAMAGIVDMSYPRGIHATYKKLLDEFECRCEHLKLGYVHGTIVHKWHGSLENRKYKERWQIIVGHMYNPSKDIEFTEEGVIKFTPFGNRMEKDIMKYFLERKEDS